MILMEDGGIYIFDIWQLMTIFDIEIGSRPVGMSQLVQNVWSSR